MERGWEDFPINLTCKLRPEGWTNQKADTKANKRECEGLAKETVCYEEYFAEGFLVPKYASYVKDMSLDKLHH